MDTVNNIMGIICIIGALVWFYDAIRPEGVPVGMQRLAYLLAGTFVLAAGMKFLGLLETIV